MNPLIWCLTLLYPALMYVALHYRYYTATAIFIGILVALKSYAALIKTQNRSRATALALSTMLGGGAFIAFSWSFASALFLPVIMNTLLLITFGISMLKPPTVIERAATIINGELPPEGIRYCRRVCAAWICFFMINGLIALDSIYRSLEWWTLYNGLISYCAAGLLFSLEYLCRRRIIKRDTTSRALAATIVYSIIISAFPTTLLYAETSIGIISEEQLQTRLRPLAPFRALFSEKRFVSVLLSPLESHGEIQCIPAQGIIWRVTKPIERTNIITPHGFSQLTGTTITHTTVDRANISAALLSLMSGNIEQAKVDFKIIISGTAARWSVTLSPKDSLVAEILQKIVVSGNRYPETIEVFHMNGDHIVTSFEAPVVLLPGEATQAQDAIRGAL